MRFSGNHDSQQLHSPGQVEGSSHSLGSATTSLVMNTMKLPCTQSLHIESFAAIIYLFIYSYTNLATKATQYFYL